MKQHAKTKMCNIHIHLMLLIVCLLSQISANPAKPGCLQSPCPSPSPLLRPSESRTLYVKPQTKQNSASYQSMMNDRSPLLRPSEPYPFYTVRQTKQHPVSFHSWMQKPSPTPVINPIPKLNYTNKQEFFERFFRSFERLRQTLHELHTSNSASKTSRLEPTPSRIPSNVQNDFQQRVRKLTDEIMSLMFIDLLGEERRSSASMLIQATVHPYSSASSAIDHHEVTRKSFFDLMLEGSKEDNRFMEKFLSSPKIKLENDGAVKNYSRNNVPKIAVGYWKLVSWFLKQMRSNSCRKDCGYIERMVQFCKDQHRVCQNAGPTLSASQSIRPSVRPSPSPSVQLKTLCSSGAKNCPFRTGCFRQNVRCMNDFDVFNSIVQSSHSKITPMPTPSRKMPNFATHVPPSPLAKSRTYNETLMKYAWREAAKQNPQLKLDDLRRTFDTFYNSLRPENVNGQSAEESREICSRMCQKTNTTFCWSEMKCKQEGAQCSLKHLAKMMNKTAFEEQDKCKLSFYCPILQNCTSNNGSCNANKFMELPCDAKCMNATGGKGIKPSSEEIEIFSLKCRSDDKYCPSQVGCVGKKESCFGNDKLKVPLGDGPEDERRAFCRLRDYICPSVYSSWKKMRCPKEEMNGSGVIAPEKPYSASVGSQTKTVKPKPTPSKTSTRDASHSSTVQIPVPQFSLPSVTMTKSSFLRDVIKLSGGMLYIAIAKVSCALSLEFQIPINVINLKKISVPDAKSGRGYLLSLSTYLRFTSTLPSFHGLCLLQFNPYTLARGERYSPKEVQLTPNAPFGAIAIIISPSTVQVDARLTGKNIINIKEDETNPPCFKLKDIIQFNITGAILKSNIEPMYESLIDKQVLSQYKSKLASLSTGQVKAAIIGAQGLSMRSGNWKQRNAMSRYENFPKYFSKQKPIMLRTDTCIAYFPAKDFNGKVRLFVIGALTIVKNGKTENIFGKNILTVGVDVLSEPDAPELVAKDSCLPAYPFNLDEVSNTGFKVEDILRAGYIRCGAQNGRKNPLIDNIAAYIRKGVGLVITNIATCKLGHWEYKHDGAFKKISIKDGSGLCLFKTARFRFVPKNYTTLWDIQKAQACLYVKVKAWLPLSANATGLCNVTDTKSSLFSKSDVQLSAVRQGCDGIDGSMRKPDACGMCGRKRIENIQCPCDKVPGSGAVFDKCGDCTGGTTGRAYKKKDCAGRCYANGTQSENVIDSCGRCQKRALAMKDARDCNGDCSFGRRRACRNKCGICVGGNTNKPLNDGINACGACIANSSAACAKSLELSKAIEVSINQQMILKIKARGYSSLRYLSCSLQITGGASSRITLRIGYAKRQYMPVSVYPDMCEEDESGDYEVQIAAAIATAGDYRLACKVDRESSDTIVNRGEIKVISQQSTVREIVPSTIDSCRNGTFILKGSGFKNSSDISCRASCEKRCDFQTRATFLNDTAIACKIEVEGNKDNCEAQEVNLHALTSAAVEPPPFSRSLAKVIVQCANPKAVSAKFISSRRLLTIKLDKPASLTVKVRSRQVVCESLFSSDTFKALGKPWCVLTYNRIYVSFKSNVQLISTQNGSKIALNITRENLKCHGKEKFSVIHGGHVQRFDVSVQSENVVVAISGGTSVGTCDDLRLDGASSTGGMGGRLTYMWQLLRDSAVVQSERRRSWFKIRGVGLTPNGNYRVRLCVANTYGQSKCKESPLTVTDNSNSTLTVKMNGAKQRKLKARGRYKFRPSARINQCGKNAKKASRMLFTWLIKDKDGVVVRTSEGRSLDIKKGTLVPGKNYTLNCYVRANLESGEDVTGETNIEVEVEGSPIEAKIRGGRELTVGCSHRVKLDAGPSNDPDNTDESSRYRWSCNEKDGYPCFNKSNPLQRLSFEEQSILNMKIGDILECNKSYVFNLEYTKGARKSSASVTVTLKPGEPAETKLELRKIRNRIIVKGYIKTASSANVSWKSIDQSGYGNMDLSDPTVATDILPGPISVRGNKKVVRRKVLALDADYLGQGSQYLIGLDVENDDGKSSAQVVVKIPSPPTPGEVLIEPSDGWALNTSFTISAGNGWGDDVSSFDIGYEIQTKKGLKEVTLKSLSAESYIDGTQLPPGGRENNHTLKAFIKTRNLDGLEAKVTIDVKVREPKKISDKDLSDAISQLSQAVNEQDNEKALRNILTLSETAKRAQINSTDLNEKLTEQAITIMLRVDDLKECLVALESTTEKRDNNGDNGTESVGLQGPVREKLSRVIVESISGRVTTSFAPESKRKRRSVENSASQDTFTPKSKEEVDSTMAIFDNIIEEEEPGNLQDNMKMNFTNTVPFLLRSLCASTATVNDFLVAKSNLSTIRSNRLSGHTFDTNYVNISDHINGSLLLLGSYIKEKYEAWNCSGNEELCTEVCIGSVLYHHHMFVGESEGRISDIASTMLIHPETHKIENVGAMASSLTYKMPLKEVPDSQHTVECRVWNSAGSNWTKDGCNTSYSGGGNASCHCSVLGNVTIFKVALPVITTLFPPIATTGSSSTMQQSTQGNSSSVAPTQSSTKGTTTTSSVSPSSIEVSFSFPVKYSDFASKATELKTAIIDMLASKLSISKSRIVNLQIKSGSIIVTFTLLGNDGHSGEMNVNDLQNTLTALASNGSLSLTFDGVTMTADAASLRFSILTTTVQAPTTKIPPPEKSKSSKTVVIIVSVCVAVVITIAIVAAVWYFQVKKKRAKNLEKNTPFGSTVPFADDIRLQERSIASQEHLGFNNKGSLDSPEPVKKPLTGSNELDAPLTSTTTPVETRPDPSPTFANDYGGVIAVGIGSASSLKRDIFEP